jgi:predicted regulator of Ras-like GTPase activity (Roadblock/LC7/MglB family)
VTTQGNVQSLGSRAEPAEVLRGVEEHIAQDWDVWSHSLGSVARPSLEDLVEDVPTMTSVLFCTADGLNLCALGVSERDVGRLAALTSSIFSVATAHRKAVQATTNGLVVHLSGTDGHTVLISVELPGLGNFVLGAFADDIPLGLLVLEVRRTATELARRLATDLS